MLNLAKLKENIFPAVSSPHVKNLSLGFALVFAAATPAERYVSIALGTVAGAMILRKIYLFLLIGDFLSPIWTSWMGVKRTLILANIIYFGWIIGLASGLLSLISPSSYVLGLSAALLWNAQGTLLNKLSASDEVLGRNTGYLYSTHALWSTVGLLAMAGLVYFLPTSIALVIISVAALISLKYFWRLPEMREEEKIGLREVVQTFFNYTVLRLASLAFLAFFIYGYFVFNIPRHIMKVTGEEYWVGLLLALVPLIALFSFWVGTWQDNTGRKPLIWTGLACTAAGFILLYFANGLLLLIIGIASLALGHTILVVVMHGLPWLGPKHRIGCLNAVIMSADDLGLVLCLRIMEKTAEATTAYYPIHAMYLLGLIVTCVSILACLTLITKRGRKAFEARVSEVWERAWPS